MSTANSSTSTQRTEIVCTRCGEVAGGMYCASCTFCDGGFLAPRFQLDDWEDSGGSFAERFAAVLPCADLALCLERESLRSPLVDASGLGRRYGIPRLLLKNESVLPTSTTKARMAAASLPYLFQRGVTRFVVSSTGNSTSAMARLMAHYPEMHMIAFAGRDFAGRYQPGGTTNVEFRVTDGDFVDAEQEAKRYAAEHSIPLEGGFFNVSRRIGLATAFLEAYTECERSPDWYFQAVSSGMGLVGVGELASTLPGKGGGPGLPKLVAVQQSSCAPIVHAYHEKCEAFPQSLRVHQPEGVARAILRGDPTSSYPHVRRWLLRSGGDACIVTRKAIFDSLEELSAVGIYASPEGGAALASAFIMGLEGRYHQDDIVVVNITGGAVREL